MNKPLELLNNQLCLFRVLALIKS